MIAAGVVTVAVGIGRSRSGASGDGCPILLPP